MVLCTHEHACGGPFNPIIDGWLSREPFTSHRAGNSMKGSSISGAWLEGDMQYVDGHEEQSQEAQPSSSWRSHETASSRDNMSVDSSHRDTDSQEDATPVVPRSRIQTRISVLTSVEQLMLRNDYKREALDLLKNQTYHHVRISEPFFFIKTGLKADMTRAFSYVGWYNFADMIEPGLKFLTMEFLMSLSFEETDNTTEIYFCFFDEQYKLTAKELSVAVGFDKKCLLDPSVLSKTYKYDRTTWWDKISEEPVSSKNSIVSIHNPTFRMLAKWICMVVHPRSDLRLSRLPELQYLFAMAKKIKLSPVMSMLAQWQKMIAGKSPIDITTLVMRIATHVKALDNAQVTYLPWEDEYQLLVGVEHFVQGYMTREGPSNSLFMTYPRYDREVELPCPRLSTR
ncbi:hypothetical protein C2845_PM11G04440 [Panicum miliaceum]|uniref:Uncharacterized protein n=1 Tax=Panicum miliaceum TaxID=4540 RepID=A0A3L6RUX3_PANMI|nr:hypothetical protein C2845_PM11G04440 [Panicum miliaceum]